MNITAGRIVITAWAACYKANAGAQPRTYDPRIVYAQSYADESGALQFAKVHDQVNALSSLSVTAFSLSSGMVDVMGDAFTPAELKAIFIENLGATALTFSSDLGFAAPIPAGAMFAWVAVDATGIVVPASPFNTLTLTNGSGAGSARLTIFGN